MSVGLHWVSSFFLRPVSLPRHSSLVTLQLQPDCMVGTPTETCRYHLTWLDIILHKFSESTFGDAAMWFYLQGWSPEPEDYKDLPQRQPESHTSMQSPYLQINLLKIYNITGNNLFVAVPWCNI